MKDHQKKWAKEFDVKFAGVNIDEEPISVELKSFIRSLLHSQKKEIVEMIGGMAKYPEPQNYNDKMVKLVDIIKKLEGV